MLPTDTIAAVATAPGPGGIGILRLSGPAAAAIAQAVCGRVPLPRQADHCRFRDDQGEVIDDGIALYFAAPASFTGEDVVELQAHGSPVLLQQLLSRCCALGARPARAGEFSQRAFLNGKIDLAQAEAVADLIGAGDLRAARAARRSLDGVFSRQAGALADRLLRLRVHLEAAIDFADEPIDSLGGDGLRRELVAVLGDLLQLLQRAEQGRRLRDGLHAVIVGPPNAGKSSLLNALAQADRAIVTEIAGTTRDLLQETVRIHGIEVTLVDTAGLRAGGDAIEREGMRRAQAELQRADLALVLLDARAPQAGLDAVEAAIVGVPQQLVLHNKADLLADDHDPVPDPAALRISARTGLGLTELRVRLAALAGGDREGPDGAFSARARHVEALARARAHVEAGSVHLRAEALELAAEELRLAHAALGELTGQVTSNDLLGHIFASFCIGK